MQRCHWSERRRRAKPTGDDDDGRRQRRRRRPRDDDDDDHATRRSERMLARVWRVLINVCVRASRASTNHVCANGGLVASANVCVCVFFARFWLAHWARTICTMFGLGNPTSKFVQGLVGGLLGLLGRQMAEADSGLSHWVELRLRSAIRERSSEFHY